MHSNKTAATRERPETRLQGRETADKLAVWLRVIAVVGAGFIAANAVALGNLAPFGVAFTASVKPKYAGAAAIGAVLGYLLRYAQAGSLKYLLAMGLLIGVQWLLRERGANRLLLTALALGLPGFAIVFLTGGTVYDGMLELSELLLGCCAAYFFSRSIQALELGADNLQPTDITSIIVSFCIATLALTGFQLWGISIGRVLAVSVILLAAGLYREAGGAIAGISGGIAAGLLSGQSFLMGTYGFGGLLAGVFAPLGRFASAGVFILINAFTLLASRQINLWGLLTELFIGAAISLLPLPERVARLAADGRPKDAVRSETYRTALNGQIGQMSDALRRVAQTTRQVNDKLAALDTADPAAVFENAANAVCRRCKRKSICWQQRYNDTSNVMNEMLGILRRQGTMNASDFPAYFLSECLRSDELAGQLSLAFSAFASRENLRRRTAQVRGVVTDQFEGMALMIDAMGQEIGRLRTQDAQAEGKVREFLVKQSVFPENVSCTVDNDDTMRLEITLPSYKLARLDEVELTLALSDICARQFDLPVQRNVADASLSMLSFSEKALYAVRWGAAQIGHSGSRLCGDSYSYVDGRAGRVNIILSDGMGSGGAAAVDSTMTAQLLKNLIEAGVSLDAGLKLVNSALLVKTGDESLATIDITGIDLYSGKAEFYKAGAAPTFLLRNGKSGYVESRSLPVGILSGVGFEKNAVALRDGDWIVMVTDGALAGGYDWLLSDLEHYKGDNPKQLCEQLAAEARRRRNDGHEDDITVLAARMEKGA